MGVLDDPAAWQQDEAALGLWQFDDFQAYPVFFGRLSRLLACVPLIHESQFHALSRRFLHGCGQFTYLSPILLIGGCDMQRQQIPQRIDCQMHFAAFAPFGSIVARPMPTFRARVPRAAVKNGSRGLL